MLAALVDGRELRERAVRVEDGVAIRKHRLNDAVQDGMVINNGRDQYLERDLSQALFPLTPSPKLHRPVKDRFRPGGWSNLVGGQGGGR